MPAWIGRFRGRQSIASFLEEGRGLVAGLLKSNLGGFLLLCDQTGELRLPSSGFPGLDLELPHWVALEFENREAFEVVFSQPIQGGSEFFRWQENACLKQRWQIHQQIRSFFLGLGFLEVDTPVAVSCPGMEPYLDSFQAGNLYLRTSPELHMKRLLAGGFEPIFQMAPCFRAGDRGRLHREEFHMLEWYRAFADLEDLMVDIQGLLAGLAPYSQDPDYFLRAPEVISCQDLLREKLDLDLSDQNELEPFQKALTDGGIPFAYDDDWDTLFFLLFLNFIEPDLGFERAVIVKDYPASQAALAKKAPVHPGRLPFCYRFELFIRGIEMANAFYELTDEEEQRSRFENDARTRQRLGKPVYAIDESFMAALKGGLPPAAGIALGVDRLVAVLLGRTDLGHIVPFP